MKKLISIPILLGLWLNLGAQLNVSTIKTENTFTGEWIRDILVDNQGGMWFADITGNGIFKFDGQTWTNYTSANGFHDYNFGIDQDGLGNIWIASQNGVIKYDGDTTTLYTTSDGLPNNDIKDILVDYNGLVWVATYDGIARYNGSSWVTYTTGDGLVSNFTKKLFEDFDNKLWIATFEGVSKLDGGFVNYTDADGLPEINVNDIAQDADSNIWFASGGGATKFDGTNWKTFTKADGLPNDLVTSIYLEDTGHLWFTSYMFNGGLTRYNGTSWITYKSEHGLLSNYTYCVSKGPKGDLWIGTGNGISKMSTDAWKYFTTDDGMPADTVYDFISDTSGDIWFATNKGISRYDGIFQNYGLVDGLPNLICFSIESDASGELWAGTSNGATRMKDSSWEIFNTDSGMVGNSINDIAYGNSLTWFATNSGISSFNGNSFTNYTTGNGLAENSSSCILEDKEENVWVGSNNSGVSKFDGVLWTYISTSNVLPSNQIWDIYEDSNDNIWIGTSNGVMKFNGANWDTLTKDDGLASNNIISIGEDSEGRMWFGNDSSKITVYNGENFVVHQINPDDSNKIVREIKEIDGTMYAAGDMGVMAYNYNTAWKNYVSSTMPGNTIEAGLVDQDNNVWIGTWGQGVGRFDGANWTSYSTTEGLSGNSVYGLAEDDSSNIWVASSSAGLSKITSDTILAYENGDGLPGTACYDVDIDSEGNVWIGTNGGISKFNGVDFTNYDIDDGLPGLHIKSVLCASSGDVWTGSSNSDGVARFNNSNWDVFTTTEGLANNNVQDICEDADGNIWFATFGGISKYDGENFVNFTSEINNAAFWCIHEDKMGNIWAGSWGFGVYMYNGSNWTNLRTSDGLTNLDIRSIDEDDEGVLWLSTYGGGLIRIERDLFSVTSISKVNPICYGDENGNIEIMTDNSDGLQYSIGNGFFSSGSFTNLPAGNYLPQITNAFDTIFLDATILTSPPLVPINLGVNSSITTLESITLDAGAGFEEYLWSTGDTTQSISINGTIEGEGINTYWARITDTKSCSAEDSIVITITGGSGLQKIDFTNQWGLYPNPSSGTLEVNFSQNIDLISKVQLINSSGVKVKCIDFHSFGKHLHIDVSDLSSGIYFVQLVSNENVIESKKLIIKNIE